MTKITAKVNKPNKRHKEGKSTGRKCSICSHKAVDKINAMVREGLSFRCISLQFGMSDMSVGRHVEKCLNQQIRALIEERKIEKAVDHNSEIYDLIEYAKRLREASEEYLTDPVTGKLTLIPRAGEILVMYDDFLDCTPQNVPKKKTDTLDALLIRAEGGSIEPTRTTIKHVDIRSFALDSIRTINAILDKVARIQGLYQKEAENEQDLVLRRIKAAIERRAKEKGVTYEEEVKNYLDNFAGDVPASIKQKLASDLVH